MFNQTAIFYVNKNIISAVTENISVKQLVIPSTLISADEVLDPTAYTNIISKFITDSKFKNLNATIAIDEALVFEKQQAQEVEQQDVNQFAKELPFDSQKLAFTTITIENKHLLLATNRQIYLGLATALTQNKNKVEYVLPAKYFSLTQSDLQSANFKDLQSKITKNPYLAKTKFPCTEADMLGQTQSTSKPTNEPQQPQKDLSKVTQIELPKTEHKKSPPFLFVVFFLLLFVLIALLVWKYYFKN